LIANREGAAAQGFPPAGRVGMVAPSPGKPRAMSQPTVPTTVSLSIPAAADYLLLVRLALSGVCSLTPLGVDEVADLKLAVTEAATNLLTEDPAGRLDFAFNLADAMLSLEIHGGTDVTASPGEQELSRALIDATVDEHEFGAGTVRLRKRFPEGGQS
jgi:hypothetical protein